MNTRNQLCACGSGKKYKKCCLIKDEAKQKEKILKSREPKQAMKDYATQIFDHLFELMRK
jgi:hypothetical protein